MNHIDPDRPQRLEKPPRFTAVPEDEKMRNRSLSFAMTVLSGVVLLAAIGVGYSVIASSPHVSAEFKAIFTMLALIAGKLFLSSIQSAMLGTGVEKDRRATTRVAQNVQGLEDRLTDKMGAMIEATINKILVGPDGLETRINKKFETFGKDVDAKFQVMSARIDTEMAATRHKAEGTINTLKMALAHTEGERDTLEKKLAEISQSSAPDDKPKAT